MIPPDTTIVSKRLRLRHCSISDIPFVLSASKHEGFCDGMKWEPPQTEEQLLAPYEDNEQSWRAGSAYTFTLETLSTGEPIGRIAIRHQDASVWNVGFWTHPEHQRMGYMTEATRTLIHFGFTHLAATEIQAAHATWNVASRRVLEKSGLRFIKHLPEGFQKRGKWVAEDLLSITFEQWRQTTESADLL